MRIFISFVFWAYSTHLSPPRNESCLSATRDTDSRMKSPFPGMDPYIERHWPDVQTSLVGSVRTLLNQRLPDDLAARAQEREGIEEEAHGEPPNRQVAADSIAFS